MKASVQFSLFLVACIVAGLLATAATCGIRAPVEAGALHPELRSLDSAYVTGYGFPFAYWVPDDSYGEILSHQNRLLWSNFVTDALLFAVATLPIVAMVWITMILISRFRQRSSQASSASNHIT